MRKVLRSELSKERATRLEGSFGTQKQHYSLARIKARNRKTEILWIFFGIHTANAVLMIDKVTSRTETGSEEVIRLLPKRHVQQIGLYEKTQKKGNNNGT